MARNSQNAPIVDATIVSITCNRYELQSSRKAHTGN